MAGRPLRRARLAAARNPDAPPVEGPPGLHMPKAAKALLAEIYDAIAMIGPEAAEKPWKFFAKFDGPPPTRADELRCYGYIDIREHLASKRPTWEARLRLKGYFALFPEKYDPAKAAQGKLAKPVPPSPYAVPVAAQKPLPMPPAQSKVTAYPWWKSKHAPESGQYSGKQGKIPGLAPGMPPDDWDEMFGPAAGYAHKIGPPPPPPEPKFSYGVVLIRDDGKVMLREPMNHFDGYCVPLDTEILTRRGWLRHDGVRVGDETIGFDPLTETARWTRVTAIHHHRDRPLVLYGAPKLARIRCTPDHRWLTATETVDGTEWSFADAIEKLRGHRARAGRKAQKVVFAVPHEDDAGAADVTPDEAALVAWIVTDGCMVAVKKSSWECSISQKKPHGKAAIEALLSRMDFPHTKREDYGGQATYRLAAHGLHRLLERTGYAGDKSALPAFVLSLSTAAVRAFFDAAYLAEGFTGRSTRRTALWQVEGPCLDALQLAAYRVGYLPVVRDLQHARVKRLSLIHPRVRDVAVEDAGRADVWCVTTELGTWTMRQDAHVCLTGNSWTFSKGGQDPGETPEQTALRETLEETGWTCTILARLPENYPGFNATTSFFLGKPGEQVQPPDMETAAVEWFTEDEARVKIGLTQNVKGLSRDLAVLCSAFRAWERITKPPGA